MKHDDSGAAGNANSGASFSFGGDKEGSAIVISGFMIPVSLPPMLGPIAVGSETATTKARSKGRVRQRRASKPNP